jgi:exonuclease SbcC
MRLERLEVGGFGSLSDFGIDFHPRLTVIVGENESGKSTVHRALRAALYGLDAGGQGRPTERSDWSRWSPWNEATYALALTYALGDGRRLRIARRLENRDHTCQVHEIGGGDVTDVLRVGRAVVPGQVHLGIDEAVFCASACVGDDGLRLGAADTPSSRADRMQEAIERLADSGSVTTATEAIAALQQASKRVGSERRLTSPLGHAVNRLRQLDVQVEDARRRFAALASEEERLRSLEADAVAADQRRADAERRWLLGRLAAIAAQTEEIAATSAEMVHLAAEIEGHSHLVSFPVEAEERVINLAAQLHEAQRASDEAAARATAAAPPLNQLRRRRAEISGGIRALGEPPVLRSDTLSALEEIRTQLTVALDGQRHDGEIAASGARRDALRREIAATGMAGISSAVVENAIDLVEVASGSRRRRWTRWAGSALLVAGAVVAALAVASGRRGVAIGAGAAAVAGSLIALTIDRLYGGEAGRARQRLQRLCPGLALDDEGLRRLAERLPRLRALHGELQREEIRLETLAGNADDAQRRLHTLAAHAEVLGLEYGLRPAMAPGSAGEAAGARVKAVLDAFERTRAIRRRREELTAEDLVLAQRQRELDQVVADAEHRFEATRDTRLRLTRLLDAAGVDSSASVAESVAAFRAACLGRQRHTAALRRRDELTRRRRVAGDRGSLDRLRSELEARLVARGGDPAEVVETRPLAPAELQDLEIEADHARQSAVVAATAAAQLRARLAEMRTNVPPVADLEDERAACIAARDRARRQLAALRRAEDLIEVATRGVHRDLAPQLAESVAERLTLLTEGRYSAVNVDTDHFAVSLLGRDRPDLVPLELVSHGTRDQVSLLLRLALAEVLSGGGERVPLLLDEPLLSADPQRRATAVRFLWNLSATNQVVLSTSDPGLLSCLQECCDGDQPAVVSMPPPAAALETVGRPVRAGRPL